MKPAREYNPAECLGAYADAITWLLREGKNPEAALALATVRVASIYEAWHPVGMIRLCLIELRGDAEAIARVRPLTEKPMTKTPWGPVVSAFEKTLETDADDILFDLVAGEPTDVAPIQDVTRNQATLYPGPGEVEHDGLRYRSKTETRIAQVLDDMNVLYFPLPVAVRHHNRKEPDFVIVHFGRVGILEVDGPHHTALTRAKEDNRAEWFDLSGVLVRHYPVSDIDKDPEGVVKRFLRALRGPVL